MATALVAVAYALTASSARAADRSAFALNAGRRYSIEAIQPTAQKQLNDLRLPRLSTRQGQVATAHAAVPIALIAGDRADAAANYGVTADKEVTSESGEAKDVALSQAAADALAVGIGDKVGVGTTKNEQEQRRVSRIYYFPLHPEELSAALDDLKASTSVPVVTRWIATTAQVSSPGFPNDRELIRLSGARDTGVIWSTDIKNRQLGFLSYVPFGAALISLGLWWASALLCAQRWRTSAIALEAMGISTKDTRRILASVLGLIGMLGAALGIVLGSVFSIGAHSVLSQSLGQRWDRAAVDPVHSVIFALVLALLALAIARIVVARDLRVIVPAYVTPRFLLAAAALPLTIGILLLLSAGERDNGEDAAGAPFKILLAAACLTAAAVTLAIGIGGALSLRSQGRAVGKAGVGYARAMWPAAVTTGFFCASTAFGAGFATLLAGGSVAIDADSSNSSLVVSQLSEQAAEQVANVWDREVNSRRKAVVTATATPPGQQLLLSTPAYVACIKKSAGRLFQDADIACPVPDDVTTNPNRLTTQLNNGETMIPFGSSDIIADARYIQDGKVGVIVLDTETNNIITTHNISADVLPAEATQTTGGIIRANSGMARDLHISTAEPYDVLLADFASLTVREQARLRASLSPFTSNARVFEPAAESTAGSSSMSWLIAYSGLTLSLAMIMSSGATFLSSADPLRNLMGDLGASRIVRLRLALNAFSSFAVAAASGCAAGVGLIHVAWPDIELTSTGWNWLLPGLGALMAWAVIISWFIRTPSYSPR